MLNFVFLSDSVKPNCDSMDGPFFKYITDSYRYSRTINAEIKPGYKNIIMIEPFGTVDGILKLSDNDIIKIKDLLSNDNTKLMIVSLADPSNDHGFERCLPFLNEHGLIQGTDIFTSDKVIFLDSNVNYKDKIYATDYFIDEATWYKHMFYDGPNSLGYISEPILESELSTFRNKKFLSFNRNNDKLHRLLLLKEYLTGKYTDSYFSFLMKITNMNDALMVKYNQEEIQRSMEYFNSVLPIELDTQLLEQKDGFNTNNTFRKDLFLDSCINIVTETSFVNNELFLSEKILKPILSYQPFIVFGPYKYLNRLKLYGFKTFSDFWDEGYDDIESPYDRIEFLINLIQSLNKLSIYEMNELYQKTKEICIYNRKLFYSLKLDTLKQILTDINNEW
jgi:hypothetical protein